MPQIRSNISNNEYDIQGNKYSRKTYNSGNIKYQLK